MPAKYLEFIRSNQSNQLIEWASDYKDEILVTENTSEAWKIIRDNILNKKELNQDTLEIIRELLRWNNAPACLTINDNKNFLIALVSAAIDTNDVSHEKNLLIISQNILNRVDIQKIPSAICWDLAILCIKNNSGHVINNIKLYAKVLSSLLTKCPYLTKTRQQADIALWYQGKLIHVSNLLSFVVWQNIDPEKSLPILGALLMNILANNKDNVRLEEIPFKLRYESAKKINSSERAFDPYERNLNKEIIQYPWRNTNKLYTKPCVYIHKPPNKKSVTFYFTYPINSGKDFDFITYSIKDFVYPLQEGCHRDDDAAVSKAMNMMINDDVFLSSIPSEAFSAHFNTHNFLNYNLKISGVDAKIEIRNYIRQVDEDNKNISLMKEKFKFKSDSKKETILEDINQFLLILKDYFDNKKPVDFLEDKFNDIIQEILLDTLLNQYILSLLAERKDNLDLIDNVLDILTRLQKKLSKTNEQLSFIIPAVFYQLQLNQIYSKYQEVGKKLEELNKSQRSENLMQSKQKRLSQYLTELINMLDVYIQAKLAERNGVDGDAISHLVSDDLKNIPVAKILNDIQNKQFLELSIDDIKKIISISQISFDADCGLNDSISKIREKAKVFKQLHVFYNAGENESFYSQLSQYSDVFGSLSEHVKLMSVAVQTIAKLFRQNGELNGSILLGKDKLEEWQDKVGKLHSTFLNPLLEMINQTNETLLPDSKGNNFFNVMINEIITATLDIIHQVILQIMNNKALCDSENINENIKANLQWARDIIPILLDQFKHINKFIPDDIRGALRRELAVIDGLCEEPKLSNSAASKKQSQQAPLLNNNINIDENKRDNFDINNDQQNDVNIVSGVEFTLMGRGNNNVNNNSQEHHPDPSNIISVAQKGKKQSGDKLPSLNVGQKFARFVMRISTPTPQQNSNQNNNSSNRNVDNANKHQNTL